MNGSREKERDSKKMSLHITKIDRSKNSRNENVHKIHVQKLKMCILSIASQYQNLASNQKATSIQKENKSNSDFLGFQWF